MSQSDEYAGFFSILFSGLCRSLFVNEYGAIGDTDIFDQQSGAADIQKQLNYSTHRFWFFVCLQNHKGVPSHIEPATCDEREGRVGRRQTETKWKRRLG